MFALPIASGPVALAFLGAALSAQLDLPKKPPTSPRAPGEVLVPTGGPRGDVAPREKQDGPLELPSSADTPALPAAEAGPPAPGDAARLVFAELALSRDPRLSAPALERLLAIGPSALAVAREQLGSDEAAVLLAAARLCLTAGRGEDRSAVAERLSRTVPAACAPLLEELASRDPVLASPEYLAGLLDHPTTAMRAAAERALVPRLGSACLSALAPMLSSPRTSTRLAALELVARVDDPAAWNLIASRLGDAGSSVAQFSATTLALIDEAEPLLLRRAFPPEDSPESAAWNRGRGYALLALAEREEKRGASLFEEHHVPALRSGLASGEPLVSGACAVALARAGFRSSAARSGTWLDREVPHQLVRVGTGAEFHADFSALERPALRALALISGETFGADGPAWRNWWLANAEGFHARHAVIELTPDASRYMVVSFRDKDGRDWSLQGPKGSASSPLGRTLRLGAREAEQLLARLDVEGIFGPERLPDARGTPDDLSVAVAGEIKTFRPAPWLEPLRLELERAVRDHRWQLYVDPRSSGGDVQEEVERWASLAPLEREREFKALLLATLRRRSGTERDAPLAELRELYGQPGLAEAADFEPLLAVLSGEETFGPRAVSLIELARTVAATGGAELPEPSPRERLLALVLQRFGPEVDPDLERVARDLPPESLRALAADPRARVRALAPGGLARAGDEESLRSLLADPEPSVQRAALAALRDAPSASLRDVFVQRAGEGPAETRALALACLARLGDVDVRDLALAALAEEDVELQRAGLAALADTADASSASLFASFLTRGPESPLYADARRGLRALGRGGVEECLRLAQASGRRARREAALFLSEALEPEAAALLLGLLAEDPRDERALWELSVLSGLDLAREADPPGAARDWWDLVVHDDALAWLFAAAERAGVSTPPRAALEGAGTPEGARFLLALAELSAPHQVERALRELERLLGEEFPRPGSGEERSGLHAELAEAVRARYGE